MAATGATGASASSTPPSSAVRTSELASNPEPSNTRCSVVGDRPVPDFQRVDQRVSHWLQRVTALSQRTTPAVWHGAPTMTANSPTTDQKISYAFQ